MFVMRLFGGAQGIYSRYEYLERIFFDAIFHEDRAASNIKGADQGKYDVIGDYKVKDYKERPHQYTDEIQ